MDESFQDTNEQTFQHDFGPEETHPQSISGFSRDDDFVQFLKQIELYASGEQHLPNQFEKSDSHLFNNLKHIKDQYQAYRRQSSSGRRNESDALPYTFREENRSDTSSNVPLKAPRRQSSRGSAAVSPRELRPQRQADPSSSDPLNYIDNLYNKFFNEPPASNRYNSKL